MATQTFAFFAIIAVALQGSIASVSPDAYWKLNLPNTQMPTSIKDAFYATSLLQYVQGDGDSRDAVLSQHSTTMPLGKTNSHYYVDKRENFFFLDKLKVGTKVNTEFKKGIRKAPFIPRDIADAMPITSNKLEDIFHVFSLDKNSKKAQIIAKQIEYCELPILQGAKKKCVTSLESMIDYVKSEIGTSVKAISSKVEREVGMMEYTITKVNKVPEGHQIACHKMDYPYALFLCHTRTNLRLYTVSLEGRDGTTVDSLALCHLVTKELLHTFPVNVAKVVPGVTYACHFSIAEDDIIWVSV